jgi:hypothetical protein
MKKKQSMIEILRNIYENHTAKRIKFLDGFMVIDALTANAMLCIYDAISDKNKIKFSEKLKSKTGFIQMANFAFSKTKTR